MSIKRVSVIPDVEGNFLVIDYGRPLASRQYRRPVRILRPELITITIDDPRNIQQEIKNGLRELIETAVQVGIDNDINLITGEYENSPPIKIHPDEINRLTTILGGRARFQLVRVNNTTPTRSFGQERIFKSAPPEITYDRHNYFEPNRKSILFMPSGEEATCSYQYIYQTFGKVAGYKKLAKDYETIKAWSRATPPQYQAWLRQYARERNIEVLDLNIQQAIDKDVKSFETELYKLDVSNIGNKENWCDEDIDKSMNVLDIIRWCMWAQVNCYVIDFDGQYYMSYNHKQICSGHPDIKVKKNNPLCMVVKVRDNHAYFVNDKNLKLSASARYETWKAEEFDEVSQFNTREDDYDYSKNDNNFWIHPYHHIKHDLENSGVMSEMDRMDIDPFEVGWDRAYDLMGKNKPEYYKESPPPTPEELMDDSGKTFYLGTDKLNGLVSHLFHNYNIKPDKLNGSTGHKIDRATYGKNKIMGRSTLPIYNDKIPDQEIIDSMKEVLPELDWSRLPTIKTIADEVYKSVENELSYWTMLNSNTRRAFFDSEIKPENQVYKEKLDDGAWAVDISRAYTTAMNDNDLEWNVYDSVCQFEVYEGEFNPSYFYLVEEKETGYPLRNIKGLVLYHGCMLRHIMDKVEIKQVIKPIRTLYPSFFVEFVEACKKLQLVSDEEISAKRLVNTFIGGLKNQDKIAHFKFHLTESENTITRAFYNGEIVSLLDKNTEFNQEFRHPDGTDPLYVISKPSTNYNIQTAQPIRLAIMDKVNEMLYLLHTELNRVLHEYNILFNKNEKLELCLTKTDCLYYENLGEVICDWKGIKLEPSDDPKIEAGRREFGVYDYEHTCEMGAPINSMIEQVNNALSFNIRTEEPVEAKDWVFKDYKKQNQVLQKGNWWKHNIPVNHKWDKITGAKLIFKLINTLGGAWIEGEGGVGKTEFLKTFQQIIDRNRIRYRFQKCIHKHNENPKAFEDLQEWRRDNPCFAIKLAPTNKACNNIGGKTLHKGLGIPVMTVDVDETTPAYFDKICSKLAGDGFSKPCYDYLVIDEISFIDGWTWSLIQSLKRRIPHLKYILCGDIVRQLPPVGEEWRNFNNAYCIKEMVSFNKIKFNYNFRTGVSGNVLWKVASKHPENYIVDNDAPLTKRNICFTNIKRKQVIAELEDSILNNPRVPNLILKKEYHDPYGGMFEDEEDYKPDGHRPELVLSLGCPLIAYKSIKDSNIAKNEFRMVIGWTDDFITLDDELDYNYDFIYDNFLSAYCITTHKSQGDTYKDKYTIHEWDKFSKPSHFKRRLRYVAQSRSTDPENNIVYKN